MKASLAIIAGAAASVMGHGFVSNFTTDGAYNQGFLRTSLHSFVLRTLPNDNISPTEST
jgi:hypothetical protein